MDLVALENMHRLVELASVLSPLLATAFAVAEPFLIAPPAERGSVVKAEVKMVVVVVAVGT